MKTKKKNISQIIILCIALVHVIISFFTDKLIFSFPEKTNESAYRFFLIDYPVCKIIMLVALFYLYTFIYKAFISKKDNTVKEIVKCAAPYLFIMIPVCLFKLPKGYLTNDETIDVLYVNTDVLNTYSLEGLLTPKEMTLPMCPGITKSCCK